MPEVSRFFGIVIRVYYDEHNPSHFHAEYSGKKAVFDFSGNVIKGNLTSKTATKLVRDGLISMRLSLKKIGGLQEKAKKLRK